MMLRYAVRSDRGLVRGNNEDSVYAGPRLLAIADGMGGHAAGEVASRLVIEALERLDEDRPLGDLLATLREAVTEANEDIAARVEQDAELEGMGTTLTALRFTGSHVGLVHVGDSRAYLLRGDQLSQITHDDTYVQSLVDSGRLTPEEAASHPRKSVILRALTGVEVDPDVSIREARVGDRYLLCTDGLSDVVTTATLADTLAEGDPQECADRLVDLALRGGGPDNVTCIVADVLEGGYGDDVPVIAGAFNDQPTSGEDSPAERAARMTRVAEPEQLVAPVGRLRRWRRPLWGLLVLVVVVGALSAGWEWTQRQYFVGRDGDEVAVFKGVDAEFGPLKFFAVKTNTDLKMDDLVAVARSQVADGITARNEADAMAIVRRLQSQEKPICPTPGGAPTPSPSATSTPVASASRSRSAGTRPTTAPVPTAVPTVSTPAAASGSPVDCRIA